MIVLNFLHHPHYSLYVAEQGGGKARRGFYFPQDDFYDAGLREAIAWVCRQAPQNALVLGVTPSVFQYYTSVLKRPDLRFQSTVDPRYKVSVEGEPYVLYQYYRMYQENRYLMTFFRAELRPQHVEMALDQTAVTVYRLCRDSSCARAPFWKGRWHGRLKGLGEL